MINKDLWPCHVVLVALYLRGGPRSYMPNRRNWPSIVRLMREASVGVAEAHEALAEAGAWQEAQVLTQPGLLAWAVDHAEQALSPVSEGYPSGWLTASFPSPPAVWFRGAPPTGPLVGVVGSRVVPRAIGRFAEAVGSEAVRLGFGVVSGGAAGCDTYGVAGALRENGETLQILPCGLGMARASSGCDISACAPNDSFSTGGAMERNALIYASARASVVVDARFREGGAWHGATDALRRRVGRLIIREDSSSPAHRALAALGALPLASPEGLGAVLLAASEPAPRLQGGLFAAA